MNQKRISKTLLVLLIAYTVTYLISVLFSVFFSKSVILLPEYRFPWIVLHGFILFFERIPAIHFSVLIILYSFLYPLANPTGNAITLQSLFNNIKKALFLFVGVTLFYVVLYESIYPLANNRISYYTDLSKTMNDLNKQKEAALKNNLSEAKTIVQWQRALYPEKESLEEELANINSQIKDRQLLLTTPQQEQPQQKEPLFTKKEEPKNSQFYLEKAEEAFENEDWASVVYFSEIAFTLDSTNKRAKRLYSRGSRIIQGRPVSEEKVASLFDQKKKALSILEAGNAIKAYYAFRSLFQANPLDKELKEYLERSKQALKEIAFFQTEVKNLGTFSKLDSDLVFLHTLYNKQKIFFHWDKLIQIEENIYIQGIEAIALTEDDKFLYHFVSEYGKFTRGRLLLTCLHPYDEEAKIQPVILKGQEPEYPPTVIALPEEMKNLPSQGFSITDLHLLTLGQLFQIKSFLSSLGYTHHIAETEILDRLIRIFSFLSLSFLSIAFGWASRFKIKEFQPSRGYLLFLPLFILIIHNIYEGFVMLNRFTSAFLLLKIGILPTRIVLIVIQGMIVVFSAIYYIKQFTIQKDHN